MPQKIDRQEWDRLLARLELLSNAPLSDVLTEVHEKLDRLDEVEIELEIELVKVENAEHPPNEAAARLVHAQHSDTYLCDLRLCRHPDCEEIWRDA